MIKKSKTRIYVNEKINFNSIISLNAKQNHLIKNVLRSKLNDEINIFDGITGEWKTTIYSINKNTIKLKVIEKIKKLNVSQNIWLVFAPIKQHRMSLVIEKATELNVSKIIPCSTEYTNIHNINKKKLYQIAIEASEQSQRLDIPNIEDKIELKTLLAKWPNDRILVYCDEKKKGGRLIIETIKNLKNKSKKWALLVGPEGGFSDFEKDLILRNKNSLAISLGNTILRSDTAITVALYCIKEISS